MIITFNEGESTYVGSFFEGLCMGVIDNAHTGEEGIKFYLLI